MDSVQPQSVAAFEAEIFTQSASLMTGHAQLLQQVAGVLPGLHPPLETTWRLSLLYGAVRFFKMDKQGEDNPR
jgi:hypothetical protein